MTKERLSVDAGAWESEGEGETSRLSAEIGGTKGFRQ